MVVCGSGGCGELAQELAPELIKRCSLTGGLGGTAPVRIRVCRLTPRTPISAHAPHVHQTEKSMAEHFFFSFEFLSV